jgi:dipeptidyl aminopeptidase/acylaminoacyl peptidase
MIPLLLIAASILPATAGAQPTTIGSARARPLAIEDYYRIRTVAAPELSPAGTWVAFTVGTRVEETNGNRSEVWVVPADGSTPARRVSDSTASATNPEWIGDARLRFSSGGRPLVVDAATGTTVPAADGIGGRGAGAGAGSGRGGGAPQPSPDGRWTVSLRSTPPPRPAPVVRSGFEQRHLDRFKGVQFDWLDFQRDGAAFPVANSRDPQVSPPQEIVLTSTAGEAERQLTRLGFRPSGLQWHPAGRALLFTADSLYREERRYGRMDIWTVTIDGQVRRLTPADDYTRTDARYSPDGRWILYTRRHSTDAVIAKRMNHGGPTDLVVVPADGGRETVVTASWDFLPSGAQWSPDSRSIYFTGGIGGTTHLFRVAPTGGPVAQVTTGERRLTGISFDRDFTRIAFIVGSFDGPSEIHVADIDGRNERQLTRVHDAFTAEVALSRSERLLFRSKDGTQIEGWLLYPYGYRAGGGPYPLIVSNHGGPHSAVGYGFDFKEQYFAANGYFVLEVNFRSSTGYGEKFLWGTWGAWGTKDGEDVIAGIDHAIAKVPIDPKRVATIGHSYGGFMSNWLITQYPDRFAAAAVGAGISNWVSDYGTADIARTKETEFFGTPWNDDAREIMIRQSPLTYAHRAKAATLFIHGEVDQRVPYEEAEQMYVALKKNGIPAKVVQYEGQAHGISGSWNAVHRMLVEREWLDRYLKPVPAAD